MKNQTAPADDNSAIALDADAIQKAIRRMAHEILAAAEEVSAVLERSEFLEEVHRRKVSGGYLLRTASRLRS